MIMQSQPATMTLVIIDDSIQYRTMLTNLLESYRSEITVLAHGGSADDALRLVERWQPDLMILDLNMPQRSRMLDKKSPWHGVAAIAAVRQGRHQPKILITSHKDNDSRDLGLLYAVHRAGVNGYLAKRDEREDILLIEAIRGVARGETYYSPLVAQTFRNLADLTEREGEIFQCLVQGASNDDIAHQFVIAPKTVKTHVSNVLGKLHLNSREELRSHDD